MTSYTLGQRVVRTAGLFQALVAFPILMFMGWDAFCFLFWTWNSSVYYFVKDIFVRKPKNSALLQSFPFSLSPNILLFCKARGKLSHHSSLYNPQKPINHHHQLTDIFLATKIERHDGRRHSVHMHPAPRRYDLAN